MLTSPSLLLLPLTLTLSLLSPSNLIKGPESVLAQPHQNSAHNPVIVQSPLTATTNLKARYKTVYACEDRILNIECEYGTKINLIRANYGRFSITQCNEQGQLEMSTDCMSPITMRIMRGKCQDKQSCSVNATSTAFGDKCPKTRKYLEAHFQCTPISEMPTSALASGTIDTVNLRTSTTPSPAPFHIPLIESNHGSSPILPPNNPSLLDSSQYRGHQKNRQSGDSASQLFSPSPSDSNPQIFQQSKTVMNSEILNYDALPDYQPNHGPNNVSSEPIYATFRHVHTENMYNPRCISWDPSQGKWSEKGSRVIESNYTHTICAFEQATSYLLIMDRLGSTQNTPSTDQILEQNPPLPPRALSDNPVLPPLEMVPPGLLDKQPVVFDPHYQLNANKNGQQQQQQSNGTNSSTVVSFFSLFGYLLAFIFILVALMTIAFVASSVRSSAGTTLKSLGNFTAFSGPKYKNGRRSDGSLHHNKDQLLVINNQNGHQFLYTPTTKINNSASAQILTSSLPGQHHSTLHQIQQQQQQHQLYSGNGTLSNLSGAGGQSNNYYYGLTGLNQLFQQQQQHHLNHQPTSYHHQANKSTISNESANSSPSSSGVESGSTSIHQQQHQQSTCLVMNNDFNLINQFSNYGQHHHQPQHQTLLSGLSNQHATLTLNTHYNSSFAPMSNQQHQSQRMSGQNNGSVREQHIYECVDDDKHYAARLLMPIDNYNSNTLNNHQSLGQLGNAASRGAMTLSSRFNQPQQQQHQQPQQSNKRLVQHPAIVRDNQATKTNIICSQMAQVTPQRATEINKFQHDVMAIFNNEGATSTAGKSNIIDGNSKLSTDC